MRPDQANDLRKLVLNAVRQAGPSDAAPPRTIVVAGGKGGVGTTTIAVRLATALARDGRRAVLVDANLAGPDVAQLCGIDDAYGMAEVLAGTRTVHEVLERGPLGVQVLPAARGKTDPAECTPQTLERLFTQLGGLGAHADFVIVDAGCGNGRVMRRFWEAADAVLLVTHPDSVAVMDAYALVKLVCGDDPPRAAILALANCVTEAATADDVQVRLDRACRRFLGFEILSAGHVPFDPCVPRAAAEQPLLADVDGVAAVAFERLAYELSRQLDDLAESTARFTTAKTSLV
jgi:flagellar biosynthesis protein FlhG